jgi:glucose-6-phosphate 1-dehydrogenase
MTANGSCCSVSATLLDDELRLLLAVENFLIEANQRRPGCKLPSQDRLCDSASVDLATVKMDFHCDDWFPKKTNVGCEISIYHVMIGDPTLCMHACRRGGAGWRIMQPVPNYDSGSDGPKATDELLTDDGGRAWRPVSLSSEQKP